MQSTTRASLSALAIALASCASRGGRGVEPPAASSDAQIRAPCRLVAPAAGSALTSPPDTVLADLADSTKWVSGGAHFAGTILCDIVVLTFRPGASGTERQAALDLVHGVVVAGRPLSATERMYLVRVPTDGTIETLFRAIAALRTLPYVSIAMPEEIIRNAGPRPIRRLR